MWRKLIAPAFGLCVVATLIPGVGRAASTPIGLVLPQQIAFSYIQHSCGGIQEQSFVTGFNSSDGFPTGVVSMTTTCSSGGRGSRPSTFSGWATVEWDFTGATVTSSALGAAPPINPTLTAFDGYGNEIYNSSNRAYLVLAAGFVPRPRVTSISVSRGPASGATAVAISGTGFTGATAVHFGLVPASFTVNSDSSISAITAAAAPGTVGVTVTTPGGSNVVSVIDQFTFIAAPELTKLTPSVGPVAGGTTVLISGSNFTGATIVMWGDTPIGFSVVNDHLISLVTPPNDSIDSVGVVVTTLGGSTPSSKLSQFNYVANGPSAVLTPSSGTPGSVLRVSGSGFLAGETVKVSYRTGFLAPRPVSFAVCSATVTSTGTFSCKGFVRRSLAGAKGSHAVTIYGAKAKQRVNLTYALT